MNPGGAHPPPFVELAPGSRGFALGGRPFTIIGHSLYRLDLVTEQDLERARSGGENTLRIWPDARESGEIDVRRMDWLLETAERLGFYLIISVFNPARLSDLFGAGTVFEDGTTPYVDFGERWYEAALSPRAVDYQKERIRFLVRRWGESPNILAWELVNEVENLYPVAPEALTLWVEDLARFTSDLEESLYGRRHLRCVSTFDPMPPFAAWLTSPYLDFVAVHPYLPSTQSPVSPVDAAASAIAAIHYCRARTGFPRPVVDTENGPILQIFDPAVPALPGEVYQAWFHNLCWAQIASGYAGVGLTLPVLTREQLKESGYGLPPGPASVLRAIDATLRHIHGWSRWSPEPAGGRLAPDDADVLHAACGDRGRVLAWFLRDTSLPDMVRAIERHSRAEGPESLRSLLWALDAWEHLLSRAGLEATSFYYRRLVGNMVRAGHRGDAYWSRLAESSIRRSLEWYRSLTEGDPWVSELWRTPAPRPAPLGLRLTGFPAGRHRVRWIDDAAGRVLSVTEAQGEEFRLISPPFTRHIALTVEPTAD